MEQNKITILIGYGAPFRNSFKSQTKGKKSNTCLNFNKLPSMSYCSLISIEIMGIMVHYILPCIEGKYPRSPKDKCLDITLLHP